MKANMQIVLGVIIASSLLASLVLASLILVPNAEAKCPVGGCGSGDDSWMESAQAFLSADSPVMSTTSSQSASGQSASGQSASSMSAETGSFRIGVPVGSAVNSTGNRTIPQAGTSFAESKQRTALYPGGEFIKSMGAYSGSVVVLDVSEQRKEGDAHLKGSINVPWKSFLTENGTLRPVPELAAILGRAGISRQDDVIVYSDSFASGEAAFVFWLLRYLGQDNAQALDGGLNDWTAASLPLEIKNNTRPSANYTPALRPELLAGYDYVKASTLSSSDAQMVDARAFQDFGRKRIPSAFSISSDQVVEEGLLKTEAQLNDTFAKLNKERPVVVYSSEPCSAALVWYALQLMGFDSRLYTWLDWQAHEEA